MAKAKNGCVVKCEQVEGKRVCPIMIPIYGSKGQCRPREKSEFDENSLFSKKSGNATITIGCPKNQWDPKTKRCKVGTRALKMTLDT